MQINGPFSIHGAQSIQPSSDIAPVEEMQATETSLQPMDELEISSEATFLNRVHGVSDVRTDRVAEIRAQIEGGIYETSDKLDIALGRLLDEFA